jgi:thiosulfate/3-mercaptopyruvate sulfurtransferase
VGGWDASAQPTPRRLFRAYPVRYDLVMLIDVTGLRNTDTNQLALLDIRWQLGRDDGRERYDAGHLPGAVYVDLETELAAHHSAEAGRHPLPAPSVLQTAVHRWGLREGMTVVVYDGWNGFAAARAWWLLRAAGVADVRILDGGLAAWRTAGLPLEVEDVVPTPGDLALPDGYQQVLDTSAAAALARSGMLLDARAADRYRGEIEPLDPRAGHIPGAISVSTAANLDAAGYFLPANELRARFTALGVSASVEIGVYCGSGISAAHEVAALAIAGFDAGLYPGSWSQWSNDPTLPVATGADPG